MRWLEAMLMRLRGLLFHKREDQRLDAEMQFHLDGLIAENIAAGMSPAEARYAALRAFGNPTVLRERTRDVWSWNWLEQLAQDFRFGARQLRRSPGFVLVTVLTLTLGIAVFFAARSIRSFLFEVQPGNPEVFAAAALALVLIGLLAAMLPARRAVSVDPMRALRAE